MTHREGTELITPHQFIFTNQTIHFFITSLYHVTYLLTYREGEVTPTHQCILITSTFPSVPPQDPYPRGEIFLGYKDDNYSVKEGVPRGCKDHDCAFSLVTPDRTFVMSAPTCEERAQWMKAINTVLERPLRPQDNQSKAEIEAKRKSSRASRHSLFSFH